MSFNHICGFAFTILYLHLVPTQLEMPTPSNSTNDLYVITGHQKFEVYNYSERHDSKHDIERFRTVLGLNSSLSMTCNKAPDSYKEFIWWFNRSVLSSRISTPEGLEFYNINVSMTNTTSRLEVSKMTKNNTGLYRCNVGNNTIMEHYLQVTNPQLTLFCNGVECATSLLVNTSQQYIFHCYCNQRPVVNPIWWEINGHPLWWGINEQGENKSTLFVNNSLLPTENKTFHVCSTLLYKPGKDDDNISCAMSSSIYDYIDIKRPDGAKPYQHKVMLTVVFVVTFHVAFIIIIATVCLVCRSRRGSTAIESTFETISIHRRSTRKKVKLQHFGNVRTPGEMADSVLTPICDTWRKLILHADIKDFGLKLHSCRFSDETYAFWEASFVNPDMKDRFVVRSISGKATMEKTERFKNLQLRLIHLKSHPNILNVLGCCKDNLPYRICYEYHPDKTVRDYLYEYFQNVRSSSMREEQHLKLLHLAHGVVNGMLFLKANNLDHVALRTDKVIYFGATVCKLYDFCLREDSPQIAKELLQEDKALPWLAPEVVLCGEYNQWTDTWALGVLLWELWSGGEFPYNKCPRVSLQLSIRNKTLLQKPSNCPTNIYDMMLACWKQNPRGRKGLDEICDTITNMKTSCQHVVQDYEDTHFPGPSFYLTLDENEYQQIMHDNVI